jgi:hypothetical protein
MMRLSMRSAQRCETAQTKRCKCRCGGLLHGAKRGQDAGFFKSLPLTDPHYAQPRRKPKREPKADPVDRPGSLYEGVV